MFRAFQEIVRLVIPAESLPTPPRTLSTLRLSELCVKPVDEN